MNRKHVPIDSNSLHQKAFMKTSDVGCPEMRHSYLLQVEAGYTDTGIGLAF